MVDTQIESIDDPIYVGQIFAEMLGAVSHPEFTSLDQEARLHT